MTANEATIIINVVWGFSLFFVISAFEAKIRYRMTIRDYTWCLLHNICLTHKIKRNHVGDCSACRMAKNLVDHERKNAKVIKFLHRLREIQEKYERSSIN